MKFIPAPMFHKNTDVWNAVNNGKIVCEDPHSNFDCNDRN